MALRIRKDGRVLCAAYNPPEEGDLYLDDYVHGYLGCCCEEKPDKRQLDNYDKIKHEYLIEGRFERAKGCEYCCDKNPKVLLETEDTFWYHGKENTFYLDECKLDWKFCPQCGRKLGDKIKLIKDTKINLCDKCQFSFPECDATVEDMQFGDGIGNDNVFECKVYNEDKATCWDLYKTTKK